LRGQKPSLLAKILVDVFELSLKFLLNNRQGKQCNDWLDTLQLRGYHSQLFEDFEYNIKLVKDLPLMSFGMDFIL